MLESTDQKQLRIWTFFTQWKLLSPLLSLHHSPENAPLYEFLESCLRHKSELVIYEAARAMVNLKSVQSKDLQPAVSGKCGTMVRGEAAFFCVVDNS